jgi:hypothetical protein
MANYSKKSADYLYTCDTDLIQLGNEVVKERDHSVTEGHRNEEEQEAHFDAKRSFVHWPDSKHNSSPSRAVHFKPYPMDWALVLEMDKILASGEIPSRAILQKAFREYAKFYHFAGYVKKTAKDLGIRVTWGGDWDSDNEFNDQRFHDLLHWELA